MCGRFGFNIPKKQLAEHFQLDECIQYSRSFNIAPTQPVVSILEHPQSGKRVVRMLKWGLVPHWSKDPKTGYKTINARLETLAEKPTFRDSFKHRRCIIPASGFFEWKRDGKDKQPFWFHLQDERPLGFAGLWSHWKSPDGSRELFTCTIVTTGAAAPVCDIHDRMPLILSPQSYANWLSPKEKTPAPQRLQQALSARKVSQAVNNSTAQGPNLIDFLA